MFLVTYLKTSIEWYEDDFICCSIYSHEEEIMFSHCEHDSFTHKLSLQEFWKMLSHTRKRLADEGSYYRVRQTELEDSVDAY